jgi:hypothetical protein
MKYIDRIVISLGVLGLGVGILLWNPLLMFIPMMVSIIYAIWRI